MDALFNFDIGEVLVNAAYVGSKDIADTIEYYTEQMEKYDNRVMGTFLSNHDQNRYIESLARSHTRAKVAVNLLFTLPGIPFVYYGEEIGMIGKPGGITFGSAEVDGNNAVIFLTAASFGTATFFTSGRPGTGPEKSSDYLLPDKAGTSRAEEELTVALENDYRNRGQGNAGISDLELEIVRLQKTDGPDGMAGNLISRI